MHDVNLKPGVHDWHSNGVPKHAPPAPDRAWEGLITRIESEGAAEFTADGLVYVSSRPLMLDVPLHRVRACLKAEDAKAAAKAMAIAAYDSDPQRALKRTIVKGARDFFAYWLGDLEQQCDHEIDLRDTKVRTHLVTHTRPETQWGLALVPRLIPLATYLLLLAFGVYAEATNAVFLLMESGFGFEGDPQGALCFVFAVIAAPYTALKFHDHRLDPHGRKRFRAALSRIGSPLAAASIALFAFTIGQLHERVDFLAEGSESWAPPLWSFFLVSMSSLAAMVAMLNTLVQHASLQLFEQKPHVDASYAESDARVGRLATSIAKTRLSLERANAVLEQDAAERQTFIDRWLSELTSVRAALAAKRAQLDSDPLDD